jgi:hypothetical protein
MEGHASKILFVIHDANFLSRIILVDAESFKQVRGAEYELLKKHSQKNTVVPGWEQWGPVANLLVRYIVWNDKRCGKFEETEWLSAACLMEHYAERRSDAEELLSKHDVAWLNKSRAIHDATFDHVRDYFVLLENHKEEIVDSFLILEADKGKEPRKPPVTTVKEMYEKYYSF